MNDKMNPSRDNEYLLPERRLIDELARRVCSSASHATANEEFLNPEVVKGLADHLNAQFLIYAQKPTEE